MRTQKQLIVKSNISEIKRICEARGIDYEITPPSSQIYSRKKPKITEQELNKSLPKVSQK